MAALIQLWRRLRYAFSLFLLLCTLPVMAQTSQVSDLIQGTTKTVSGVVLDSSGAPIPATKIEVICGSLHRMVLADAVGAFRLDLPDSTCVLTATAPGFDAANQDLAVIENESTPLKLILNPAMVQTTVTVTADNGYAVSSTSVGTKTPTSLLEIPQAVSVVTRQQMDDQDVESVSQSLRYTAGVFSESRMGSVLDSIFLRGFGGYAGSSVNVGFLDELEAQKGLSWAQTTIDPYTIESVEVLRGPSSILYGQANPGGIINMVSKRPAFDEGGARGVGAPHEVTFESGTRDRYQGTFDWGGQLGQNGRLAYRLAGIVRYDHTQVDYSQEKRLALAPSLMWRVGENTTLTFLINLQRDPSNNYSGWLPAQGTLFQNPAGKIPTSFYSGQPNFDYYKRNQILGGYRLEHSFRNGWVFRQNLRYQHLDVGFAGLAVNYLDPFGATTNILNRYTEWAGDHQNGFVLDNQGQFAARSGPVQHTVLVGGTYDGSIGATVASGYGYAPQLNYLAPVYDFPLTMPSVAQSERQTQNTGGAYIQDQVRFRKWSVLLGAREDWLHVDTRDRLLGTLSSQPNHAFSGRAGGSYVFENGLAPYISYSTSFQPVLGVDSNGNAFKPSDGKEIEGGIKYQPRSLHASFRLSAFDINQNNVSTTDPNNPNYSVQLGKVRSWGVEAEAHADISSHIGLIASYAYTNPTVKQNPDASLIGKHLDAVPQQMASFWGNYSIRSTFLTGLHIGAGIRYQGKSPGDDANSFNVPGTVLVDTTWRYDLDHFATKDGHWSIGTNVSNLLDKQYVTSCFSMNGCFYGYRRVIKANLRYRW
jgi:iron complex outermembrane receptor protein